jgi:N-acetylmuramoyl-L-alanine amidase
VIHWTGDTSFDGACAWHCDPRSKVSSHFIVGRNGEVASCVPLDRQAWHAGESSFENRKNCNEFSIGIELVNAGEVKPTGTSRFITSYGKHVNASDVVLDNGRHFHAYSNPQLDAAKRLLLDLAELVPTLANVAGHNEISPGRKADPGPVFPMAQMRSMLAGRRE